MNVLKNKKVISNKQGRIWDSIFLLLAYNKLP